MSNLGRLYKFELKKLAKRKMLWITLIILLAVTVFIGVSSAIGRIYISSDVTGSETVMFRHYDMVQAVRADPMGLDGRPFDTQLFQEAIDALGPAMNIALPEGIMDEYSEYAVTVRQEGDLPLTEDYLTDYAIRTEYTDVWDVAEVVVGSENMTRDLTGGDFYDTWDEVLKEEYAYAGLSDGEITWWNERSAQLERPFTCTAYATGWGNIAFSTYLVNILIMLFAAIALSGVFPYERQRQTDALAMCTKNGKAPLYLAKLLASLTVSLAGAAALFGALIISCLVTLGTEGFQGIIQLMWMQIYAAPMSVGKLALIGCGLGLLAALVHAVFTLVLSLVYKGGMPTMATVFGLMLVTSTVDEPFKDRILNQAYGLLPSVMDAGGILSLQLIPLGGYLTSYQFAPILWLSMILALAYLGYLLHRRMPVK